MLKSLKETWYKEFPTGYEYNDFKEIVLEGKMLIDITIGFIKDITQKFKTLYHNDHIPKYHEIVYDKYIPFKKKLTQDVFEFEIHNAGSFSSFAKSKLATPEGLPTIYEKVFEPNISSLGHYFRNLFHFIKFVDEYKGFDLSYTQNEIQDLKYKYIRLTRAQLSDNELILLALNSITEQGEAFIPLIERFKLLKNTNIHKALNFMEGLLEKYPHLEQPL